MQTLQQKGSAQAWPAFQAVGVDRRAAPTVEAVQQRREALVDRYQRECPEAGRCLLDEAEARLNPLFVPQRPHQYGRPSNLAARAWGEERRRTKVIPLLLDESSLVQLVFAVLIRGRDRWGKKCLRECGQQHLRSVRKRRTLDEQEVRRSELTTDPPSRSSAASAASPGLQGRGDLTVTTALRTYEVDGQAKVGNFTISFEDLTIPVAGIPITITRTYDSRNKATGDFGVGWTLAIKDLQVFESTILGPHWEQTVVEATTYSGFQLSEET